MIRQEANDEWLSSLTLNDVSNLLAENSASDVALKVLPEKQDNDKNQIYLGMDLSVAASRLPAGELRGGLTRSGKRGAHGRTRYQADLDFYWITRLGPSRAPKAKLIYYPQYPEVRLSGIMQGCVDAPRTYYAKRLSAQVQGRVLILAASDEKTLGLLLPPTAPAAEDLAQMELPREGVLRLWQANGDIAMSPDELLAELLGVHLRGYVPGCRITRGVCKPYFAGPAGGATLEAQLGVETNSRAEPDFAGWELKSHTVTSLDPIRGLSPLTLFTQEPDGGLYNQSFTDFMQKYGYESSRNPGRLNFVGTQRVGAGFHARNGLRLALVGVDDGVENHDPDGHIALVDRSGFTAATWSFVTILEHWRQKHARCAYVPMQRNPELKAYRYGAVVTLAAEARFPKLLAAIQSGTVFYDPGSWLKISDDGSPGRSKRRNQWRVRHQDLVNLYEHVEVRDARSVGEPDNTVSARALRSLGVTLTTPDLGRPTGHRWETS